MQHLTLIFIRLHLALVRAPDRDERGDVPGWVLVTVMSVGLVTVIWKLAEGQLGDLLTNALAKVK